MKFPFGYIHPSPDTHWTNKAINKYLYLSPARRTHWRWKLHNIHRILVGYVEQRITVLAMTSGYNKRLCAKQIGSRLIKIVEIATFLVQVTEILTYLTETTKISHSLILRRDSWRNWRTVKYLLYGRLQEILSFLGMTEILKEETVRRWCHRSADASGLETPTVGRWRRWLIFEIFQTANWF